MDDPYFFGEPDPEIEAEIAECERLEALADVEKDNAERREAMDAAYDEWADVAIKTGVPHTYRQGA